MLIKQSSEPIKTPSSVSFVLQLTEEPPKSHSVGIFELKDTMKAWYKSGTRTPGPGTPLKV